MMFAILHIKTGYFCITTLLCFLLFILLGQLISLKPTEKLISTSLPNRTTEEKELPECDDRMEVCNVVYNRPWLRPLIVQLCRCPQTETHKTQCPTEWTEEDKDLSSQYLNARAQLKLCREVKLFPTCKDNELAVEVVKHTGNGSSVLLPRLRLFCRCPQFNYYKLILTNETQKDNMPINRKKWYTCKPLGQSQTEELCAYFTDDMNQPYFIGSCPPNHICLRKNNYKGTTKDLLLYEGIVYNGICIPWPKLKGIK